MGRGNDLDATQVEIAVASLVDREIAHEPKAEFLKALRRKGESAAEIAAFVDSLLERAVDPGLDAAQLDGPLLDVCGTGGDRLDLFNVSTTAMFVLAAGGAIVVKHGNRGITSKCGGADVLEELGVKIDLPPAAGKRCVEKNGVGFLFAPSYHPAFKAIAPVRQALAAEGVTTVFNMLGPLLNPACPDYQLIGVFASALLPKFAATLVLLQRTRAWAVHGTSDTGGGVDEISTMGSTEICQVDDGKIESLRIEPEDFGLLRVSAEELRGGDCEENAQLLQGILRGKIRGAKRDVVLLNAAAGFVICHLAPDLPAGLELAQAQIASGRAWAKLQALQKFS